MQCQKENKLQVNLSELCFLPKLSIETWYFVMNKLWAKIHQRFTENYPLKSFCFKNQVDEHLTSCCSYTVMHTNTSGNFVLVVVRERKSEICPQEG